MSIAAYRDPELGPTIEDCLAKARFPERLRFGVCWQHAADEPAPSCFDGRAAREGRIDVVDVDWTESGGMCWARAESMKLWRGEDWFLQLDSHHRFVPGWDVVLTEQAAATGSPRPVLTTYAPAYRPGEPDPVTAAPLRIEFDRFTDEGIAMQRPGRLEGWEQRTRPYRGRFASGHLFFAPGRFVEEVPWDPELYFTGDEITLAVRTFTHGYDLFVPSRLVLWHAYANRSRPKHWNDHGEQRSARLKKAEAAEAASRAKIARLLTEPWVGRFGLGAERTLADYEAYAGISFRHRRVQPYTRLHREPPNPPAAPDWAEHEPDRAADGLPGTDSTGMGRVVDLWLDRVRDELVGLLRRDDVEVTTD